MFIFLKIDQSKICPKKKMTEILRVKNLMYAGYYNLIMHVEVEIGNC